MLREGEGGTSLCPRAKLASTQTLVTFPDFKEPYFFNFARCDPQTRPFTSFKVLFPVVFDLLKSDYHMKVNDFVGQVQEPNDIQAGSCFRVRVSKIFHV